MTKRAEDIFVTGAVAVLGGLAIALKGIEAANAWINWQQKRQPPPRRRWTPVR